jgi:predicted N-acetyltransferase YhbS
MIQIRQEKRTDIPSREALLNAAMGEVRFTKCSERLREDRVAAEGLSFVAVEDGRLIGTVRLWHVTAGPGRSALLLGPMAVAPEAQGRGIGSALMTHAVKAARRSGAAAVILVGDAPYYSRFGFSAEKTGALWMPGAYDQNRLLALELKADSLDGAQGLVSASGKPEPKPSLAKLIAGLKPARRRAARALAQAA